MATTDLLLQHLGFMVRGSIQLSLQRIPQLLVLSQRLMPIPCLHQQSHQLGMGFAAVLPSPMRCNATGRRRYPCSTHSCETPASRP